MKWTEQQDRRLKDMWTAGEAARVIADRIGVSSANAVIGRAKRIGLPRHKNAPDRNNPKGRKRSRKRSGFSMPAMQPAWRAGDHGARISRAAHMRQAMNEPVETSSLPPISQRVTFMELKGCHCKYPFGDKDTGFFFCGAPKVIGSYCLAHDMLCRPGAYPTCEPVYPAVKQSEAV